MDFQNRQYDPQIGRFLSVDPLADDDQEEWSPYAAMGNNPAMMVDPLGLSPGNTETPATDYVATAIMSTGGKKDNTPGANEMNGEWMDADMANEEQLKQEREERDALAGNSNEVGYDAIAIPDMTCNYAGEGSGGGGDEKASAAANVGGGFVGGMHNTWEGIKNQFTVSGYLNNLANIGTLGIYGMINQVNSAAEIATNLPNYTAADYQYAGGFVLAKTAEFLIFKKIAPVVGEAQVSWSGFSRNISGNLKFGFKVRFPSSNLMVRLERAHRTPFSNTKVPYAGKLFNGYNTHINIQKPGSYNYHFVLNPFKWKYYVP